MNETGDGEDEKIWDIGEYDIEDVQPGIYYGGEGDEPYDEEGLIEDNCGIHQACRKEGRICQLDYNKCLRSNSPRVFINGQPYTGSVRILIQTMIQNPNSHFEFKCSDQDKFMSELESEGESKGVLGFLDEDSDTIYCELRQTIQTLSQNLFTFDIFENDVQIEEQAQCVSLPSTYSRIWLKQTQIQRILNRPDNIYKIIKTNKNLSQGGNPSNNFLYTIYSINDLRDGNDENEDELRLLYNNYIRLMRLLQITIREHIRVWEQMDHYDVIIFTDEFMELMEDVKEIFETLHNNYNANQRQFFIDLCFEGEQQTLVFLQTQLNLPPLNDRIQYLYIKDCDIINLDRIYALRNCQFLTLQSCQLRHIDDHINNLIYLKYLDLSVNNIRNQPNFELDELVMLDLSYNFISTIMIDNLPRLRYLMCKQIHFNYSEHSSIRNCVQLRFLHLSEVKSLTLIETPQLLTLIIFGLEEPLSLENYPVLKFLTIKHHKLTNFIGESYTLEYLDLSDGQLEEFPVLNMLELKEIKLFQNQISYVAPNFYIRIPKLQVLYLDNNLITYIPDNDESDPNYLPRLRLLSITNNQLNELPTGLGNLKYLQKLNFISNEVATLPISFNKLHRTEVNLFYNPLTDNAPLQLGKIINVNKSNIKWLRKGMKPNVYQYGEIRDIRGANGQYEQKEQTWVRWAKNIYECDMKLVFIFTGARSAGVVMDRFYAQIETEVSYDIYVRNITDSKYVVIRFGELKVERESLPDWLYIENEELENEPPMIESESELEHLGRDWSSEEKKEED